MEYLKSMTEIGLAEPLNDRLTVETSHPDNSTLIVQSRKNAQKHMPAVKLNILRSVCTSLQD